MPEWVRELLAALGGGTVVLVGILTIFKGFFIKLFESGMDSSFEKSIEKFKNRLDRSTRAYEILLDREMRFYERIEPITAELVPLAHDLLYYLKRDEELERETECEAFREKFQQYCELIKTLKNEALIHQVYIPQEVFTAYTAVIAQMQEDVHYWFAMAKLLYDGKYHEIDYAKGEKAVDDLLLRLAFAGMTVKKRLLQLSGDDK